MTAIVIKLLVVFLVVMALVAKKQPIYVAVTAGAVVLGDFMVFQLQTVLLLLSKLAHPGPHFS